MTSLKHPLSEKIDKLTSAVAELHSLNSKLVASLLFKKYEKLTGNSHRLSELVMVVNPTIPKLPYGERHVDPIILPGDLLIPYGQFDKNKIKMNETPLYEGAASLILRVNDTTQLSPEYLLMALQYGPELEVMHNRLDLGQLWREIKAHPITVPTMIEQSDYRQAVYVGKYYVATGSVPPADVQRRVFGYTSANEAVPPVYADDGLTL